MKKICLIISMFAATIVSSQQQDYIISTSGLGGLKLGMVQSEVEFLLSEKIVLLNSLDTASYIYKDTARVVYKNINVELEFERKYYDVNKFQMQLVGIIANSPLCKTKSGIGIGSDWLKIIKEYENYHVKIQPGYANYYETENGEGKSTLTIFDNISEDSYSSTTYLMAFFLLNNKVISFELKSLLNY